MGQFGIVGVIRLIDTSTLVPGVNGRKSAKTEAIAAATVLLRCGM